MLVLKSSKNWKSLQKAKQSYFFLIFIFFILRSKKNKIEEKVEVTRAEVVSIVTSSFEDKNEINKRNLCIRYNFNICSLNLYCEDMDMFERHLGSLSENKKYKVLTDKSL